MRYSKHRGAYYSESTRGFTLTEVLVMMLLVSLIALITLPNLRRFQVKSGSTQALIGVFRAFDLARFEAVKRHSPVGINYDASQRRIIVFEDWHPENIDLTSNGNQVLDPGEDWIDSWPLPSELNPVDPPAADTDPLPAISNVIYRRDGSLTSGAGAAYLNDKVGNVFRVRINEFTGTARVEQWLEDESRWSADKEAWQWKY